MQGKTEAPPRIIVCTGCKFAHGDGETLFRQLEAILDEADIFDPPFKARTASCLDMCDDGPNLVVHPGNHRYNHVDDAKLKQILAEHVYGEKHEV